MVEIIRQGQRPEDRRIETTCTRCKTVFAFQAHEARLVPDQRDGDFYQLPCPICSSPVSVAATVGRDWRHDR